MRELQWTRFSEAKPTDESKELVCYYVHNFGKGRFAHFAPGDWHFLLDDVKGRHYEQWAYDPDPIAPPREPEEEIPELESCPICGKRPYVAIHTEHVEVGCFGASPDANYEHRLTRGTTTRQAIERWNTTRADAPTDLERVTVSIGKLRDVKKLIGLGDQDAEECLDEIIASAEPVGERVCRWMWDKIGRRWNTECGDQYQFADCKPCPRCHGRIVKEE